METERSSKLIAQGESEADMATPSKYVIAAMCGCWRRESGVNPAIWESLIPCSWDYEYEYTHKGGYGLGQWTNVGTQHGRLYNLHTWATANGYADGDGNGQLEFMLHEGYWTNSSQSRLGYTSLNQFLASTSTNLNDLVWDFLANWEGVAGDHYSQRCQYAQQALDYIDAHAGDGNTYTWISGNRYLSTAETNNNVMVVYNYLNGEIPTGQWVITMNVTGNGTAYTVPSRADTGDTITLYSYPASGEFCIDMELRETISGQSIASTLDPTLSVQSFTMPNADTTVIVLFTGTPPPPPPPPTIGRIKKHKMPVWMYPYFRCRC